MKYAEKQELEKLPGRIETLESDIGQVHAEMADPAFYQQDRTVIADKQAVLKALESDLAKAYARWEQLELLTE